MFRELIRTITLKDVMSTPVITVQVWEDFHVVYDKFTLHGIRHLPVVDDAGRLVGLVSQRHLYKLCSPRRKENGGWYYDNDMLDAFILKQVMVGDPYVLRPHNTLEDAMKDMVRFKFGCIPIVDDNSKPVGMITRDNLINFFLTYDEQKPK